MMIYLLLLLSVFSDASLPVKCAIDAPYNPKKFETIIAVDKAVKDGTAIYTQRLATMIENLNTLPNEFQVEKMLDYFMEVFCKQEYFEGFSGITLDDKVFKKLSEVRALYKNAALSPGTKIPFNVQAYNMLVTIDDKQAKNHRSIYANLTAFNRHFIRADDKQFVMVLGHYQNKWRIDSDGDLCIAAFTDTVLDVFLFNITTVIAKPWDLRI